MITKITLEDKGQDILWFRINEGGLVEEAGPFQNEIWQGAYIPYWGGIYRAIMSYSSSTSY